MKQFQRHTLAGAILAAAATTQAQTMLEEVTVTAQKRSENVMDVPIAISVFNNNALEQLSARNLTDLGRFTSGVEMNNMNSLQPTYTIRGIQTNDWTVGSDPAVAVYVDGVYAARGAGAEAALADIARIEVLKGPQGTLFGRNATGGAIHIISHAPVHERQGRARLTLGDYNRFDGEVMFNTPLSDTLAVRLMAVNRNRDGYLENLTGPDMGEQGTENYRASVLWDAGPATEVLWRVEYSDLDQNAGAHYTVIDSIFEGDNAARQLDPFGDIANDFESRETREMFSTSLQINQDIGDLTLTSITGWRQFDAELREDLDGSDNPDYYFASLNTDDNEYFSQELRLTGDTDKVKWTAGLTYSRESVDHATTADFRMSTLESFAWTEILSSPTAASSQAFLAGLAGLSPEQITALDGLSTTERLALIPDFRQQQRARGVDGIASSAFIWNFLNAEGNLGPFGIASDPAAGMFQILGDVAPRIAVNEPWTEAVDSSGTYQSYAFYGDATYSISDRLNLTGGLRYTYDDKTFDLLTQYRNQIVGAPLGLAFYNNGQPVLDSSQDDTWEAVSGRLVLDYNLSDNVMVYASVANGFKSGGFNSLNFGPDIDTSYDEEEVINYEVGSKGAYLDGRLQLSTAAFFYEYSNLQELKLLGQPIPSYNLRNADADGYGVELDGRWLITDNLSVSGNYSWLKTEYTDFDIVEAAGETAADDLTGQPRIDSPEHKVNLAMQYRLALGNFGDLTTRFDYTWVDERVDSLNDPSRKVDAYDLANLRVSLRPGSERWELSAWSTNLFDEEVIAVYGDDGAAVGSLTGWRIPPRMVGMDVLFHF